MPNSNTNDIDQSLPEFSAVAYPWDEVKNLIEPDLLAYNKNLESRLRMALDTIIRTGIEIMQLKGRPKCALDDWSFRDDGIGQSGVKSILIAAASQSREST
jgi:hypothetical protein